MSYEFKATPEFWRAFRDLNPDQQAKSLEVLKIFKADPFDARLRTHQIHSVSARVGRVVYSVRIAGNLRALFTLKGNMVVSLDIGTHDIYQ